MSTPLAGANFTGAEYVQALSARDSDLRARTAFRTRALELVPPGGAIFDFGAGPGLDARFYAEQGFRVGAYDVDPQMCAYFLQYCADFIDSGRVHLEVCSYPEFLAGCLQRSCGTFDLVTANFAPLSMVDNLTELFRSLAALTTANGAVLASVLSPYCVADLQYPWWWRNAPQLLRTGRYAVQGAQARIWRRRLRDFAAAGAGQFALQRVFPGPPLRGGTTLVPGLEPKQHSAWLRLSTCRFMFLLFRKPLLAVRS
jgi:SAM-dependent methyltransferase